MDKSRSVGSVTSRDGTQIGYLRQGTGPGIVLVQGAMADVHAYRDFAAALAKSHTVFTAERRGRGMSPRPYDKGHDIARDVEDLDAILNETKATSVFGLSSGAVIALEAARTLSRVERAVIYEPPFYPHGISREGITELHSAIERADLPSALVSAIRTAGTAPTFFSRAPTPVLHAAARVVLALDARRSGPASSLRDLLPGVRYDFHDVAQVDGHMDDYSAVDAPVLILSGTKSPPFLQAAAAQLCTVLPRCDHVKLDGLGHDGPWNDGDPLLVARTIDRYLDITG